MASHLDEQYGIEPLLRISVDGAIEGDLHLAAQTKLRHRRYGRMLNAALDRASGPFDVKLRSARFGHTPAGQRIRRRYRT